MAEYAVGIDFGTTKSLLAYIDRDTNTKTPPSFTKFLADASLTPSPSDAPYYRRQMGIDIQPVPTVISINRLSKDLHSPHLVPGFSALNKNQPGFENYHLVSDIKARIASTDPAQRTISLDEKHSYPVVGLAACFFAALRKHATDLQTVPVDKKGVTITVPAKSSTIQRMSTRFAALVAGFKGKIELLEEPVAAFLYHRHIRPELFENKTKTPQCALVLDLGGGTCDLAVIEYEQDALPKVIGRAMARFGGGDIDKLFLYKFWLEEFTSPNKPESETPLMSSDEFEGKRFGESNRALLLAHARLAKEHLSSTGDSFYIKDVEGVIPNKKGRERISAAPKVYRADFEVMLQEAPIKAYYPSDNDEKSLSVKEHLETLIKSVLKDSDLNPNKIKHLIFAGGSVHLPGIRDWALNLLEDETGEAHQTKKFKEGINIHSNNPEICVAGGAAVHQLYKHHKKKKWRKVIEPTLSTDFELVHFQDWDGGEEKKSIMLGKQKDLLPIVKNQWNPKIIMDPKPWPRDGKYHVEIRAEDDLIAHYTLEDKFSSKNRLYQILKALMVTYEINEFGILTKIELTPGSIFGGFWKKESFVRRPMEESKEVELLQLTDGRQIDDLRNRFITKSIRL